MLKMILIQLFIFSSSLTMAKIKGDQLQETKQLLESLLPFHKKQQGQFKIDQCKTDKSKWMLLLISKQPFTEKVKFQRGCDIQGQYTTKMGIPFPVKLKLRHLENFKQVQFNFLIRLSYDPVPMIKVDMQNGKLTGKKDQIHFDVEYAAEIDPLSKEFIKNDKGGTITIDQINDKKINQTIPIKPRG